MSPGMKVSSVLRDDVSVLPSLYAVKDNGNAEFQ